MKTRSILVMCVICISVFFAFKPAVKGYQVGDVAADFKLKNVDNKMVSMGEFKDAKGFIVIFDCNSCPYSKAYNSRIIALNKKYAALGFPVIAINPNDPVVSPDDSFEEMVAEANKKKYDFPYLFDATQEVAKSFGATNTPHVYVLNKSGKELKVAYIGTIDDNARNAGAVTKRYVENAVDALIAGKPVEVTKTRALGCGIKWKNS